MDLEQLDAWLDELRPRARVNGVSMLDGYLTALVVGPTSIPPDEWFDDLLGAHGRIAVARGTMLAAIEAIVARFNAIGETLPTAPARCAPIFEKTEDGLAQPHPWCLGFLAAMQLRLDAWRPLLDAGRAESLMLLPIMLYCGDAMDAPFDALPRGGPDIVDLLRNAYHEIPRTVPTIRDYWMPKRVREANGQR